MGYIPCVLELLACGGGCTTGPGDDGFGGEGDDAAEGRFVAVGMRVGYLRTAEGAVVRAALEAVEPIFAIGECGWRNGVLGEGWRWIYR